MAEKKILAVRCDDCVYKSLLMLSKKLDCTVADLVRKFLKQSILHAYGELEEKSILHYLKTEAEANEQREI